MKGGFSDQGQERTNRGEWQVWGMKTRSRDQGRTAGVGSVKRRSPKFEAMGEKRRNLPLPG